MRKRKILLAALAVSVLLWIPGFESLAVTGTVNGDNVYVRSDASTSAGVVGYADKDYTFEVGEAKQDSDGMTWYQITLADGTTGYIRSDFVDITADDTTTESTESTDAGDALIDKYIGTTEDATTETTEEYDPIDESSGYTVEQQADGSYALKNLTTGESVTIGDLQEWKDQLTANNEQISSAEGRSRGWAILLAVVLAVAAFLDYVLYEALKKVTGFRISVWMRRFIRALQYAKQESDRQREASLRAYEDEDVEPERRRTTGQRKRKKKSSGISISLPFGNTGKKRRRTSAGSRGRNAARTRQNPDSTRRRTNPAPDQSQEHSDTKPLPNLHHTGSGSGNQSGS